MNYTDAQKAEAVRLSVDVGTAEAARQTGASKRSIVGWVKVAGVTAQAKVQKTESAREVLAAVTAKRREELDGLLLDAGIHHLQRSIAADSGRDAQAYMIGAGIGVDKYRLEMGEVTGRTEQMSVPQAVATLEEEVTRMA